MAIASITAWLNNPDRSYNHGRLLFEQYGDDRVLLALLKSGSTSFHFSKLQTALERLNKKSNLEPKQIVIAEKITDVLERPDQRPIGYENAPNKILEIRNLKNKRYAQARHLFESIRVLDSKELRLQAGLELLDHMDYVADAWGAIDDWKENGRIRELAQKETEKEVADLTFIELVQESKNLPPNISKDRTKLKEANDPKKQTKIATRLEARERRLEMVKRRLANELV